MSTAQNKSIDIQRACAELVDREVYYCVSPLVHELTQKREHFPEREEDFINAWWTAPDYEECLIENECETFTDDFGVSCWRDTRSGETHVGDAESACEAFNLDVYNYSREVFEHWLVSDWLADKLEERGERVLRDFFGLTVWGRTTTGQAIRLDHVIERIWSDLHS